jgi:acetyl esterase/lipase
MKNLIRALLIIAFAGSITASGQEYRLPLYSGIVPNSKPSGVKENVQLRGDMLWISNVQVPDIAVYLPVRRFATGQAVVICPGGGYSGLAYDLEGADFARYLNSIGIAGIVLKYRLPSKETSLELDKSPLMDAQRAIRLVRFNAIKWNIDPAKIGIMGSSAGGHLASTLGTHFDYGNKTSSDSVETVSCRPDFMILVYPVISFADSITHKGSKRALIGDNPDKEMVKYYSNELQVKEDTPPTFIVHATNDTTVPVENSILMYNALHKKKISVEMHILSEGSHGFGLALNNDHVATWTTSLKAWVLKLNAKK